MHVRDRGEERRPGLARGLIGDANVTGRVVAQPRRGDRGEAPVSEVGRGRRAGDRPPRPEQTARGLRRIARRRNPEIPVCPRHRGRESQEGARLDDRLAHARQAARETDEIEQVAMLARGGVGPMARGARAGGWTVQAHVEAPPRAVGDVADAPVAAAAASVRQIRPAHGLGAFREPARQIGGRGGQGRHDAPPSRRRGPLAGAGLPARDAHERVPVEHGSQDHRTALARRHEQAQRPGDDFADAAERLQPFDRAVGKAHQLDPRRAHDAGAAHLQPVREVEGCRSVDDRTPRLHGRERGRPLDAEVAADPVQGRGRDQAADDALAVVGLQPVDPAGLVRQARPDRQQQAGDDVERAVRERRHRGELRFPGFGERLARRPPATAVCASAVSLSVRRSIGRIRRTRRSTSPSSSIRLGAGTCTAARPDWALTSRRACAPDRLRDRAPRRGSTRPVAVAAARP